MKMDTREEGNMEEEGRKQKGEDSSVGLLNGLRREMRRGKREIGPEGGQSGRLGVYVCKW